MPHNRLKVRWLPGTPVQQAEVPAVLLRSVVGRRLIAAGGMRVGRLSGVLLFMAFLSAVDLNGRAPL